MSVSNVGGSCVTCVQASALIAEKTNVITICNLYQAVFVKNVERVMMMLLLLHKLVKALLLPAEKWQCNNIFLVQNYWAKL